MNVQLKEWLYQLEITRIMCYLVWLVMEKHDTQGDKCEKSSDRMLLRLTVSFCIQVWITLNLSLLPSLWFLEVRFIKLVFIWPFYVFSHMTNDCSVGGRGIYFSDVHSSPLHLVYLLCLFLLSSFLFLSLSHPSFPFLPSFPSFSLLLSLSCSLIYLFLLINALPFKM